MVVKETLQKTLDTASETINKASETLTEKIAALDTAPVQKVVIEIQEEGKTRIDKIVARWHELPAEQQRFYQIIGISMLTSTLLSVAVIMLTKLLGKKA